MDGIVNIIKELLGSKLTCAGVCFTAAFMHYGPKFTEIPALPEEWKWVPFVIMLFTFFLCAWWVISSTFVILDSFMLKRMMRPKELKPADLTVDERKLITYIVHHDNGPEALGLSMEFRSQFPDKVALNVAAHDLIKKHGLLTVDMGDFVLTEKGHRFVHQHREDFRQQ